MLKKGEGGEEVGIGFYAKKKSLGFRTVEGGFFFCSCYLFPLSGGRATFFSRTYGFSCLYY